MARRACGPQNQIHTHLQQRNRTRGVDEQVGHVREEEERQAARRRRENTEKSGAGETRERRKTTAWGMRQKHKEKRA